MYRPTKFLCPNDGVAWVAGQLAASAEAKAIPCPLHAGLEVVDLAVEDVGGADHRLTVGRLSQELLLRLTRHCNHNGTF